MLSWHLFKVWKALLYLVVCVCAFFITLDLLPLNPLNPFAFENLSNMVLGAQAHRVMTRRISPPDINRRPCASATRTCAKTKRQKHLGIWSQSAWKHLKKQHALMHWSCQIWQILNAKYIRCDSCTVPYIFIQVSKKILRCFMYMIFVFSCFLWSAIPLKNFTLRSLVSHPDLGTRLAMKDVKGL